MNHSVNDFLSRKDIILLVFNLMRMFINDLNNRVSYLIDFFESVDNIPDLNRVLHLRELGGDAE